MYNSTIKPKIGQCVDCPEGSSKKYLTAGRCSYHYKIHRSNVNGGPKKIAKRSKKGQKEDRQYTIKRLRFLAQPGNQRCPVTGQMATEIHHMKGRVGDLLLDQKYWLAVSREGHRKIEENPDWAKEMGYSISRI